MAKGFAWNGSAWVPMYRGQTYYRNGSVWAAMSKCNAYVSGTWQDILQDKQPPVPPIGTQLTGNLAGPGNIAYIGQPLQCLFTVSSVLQAAGYDPVATANAGRNFRVGIRRRSNSNDQWAFRVRAQGRDYGRQVFTESPAIVAPADYSDMYFEFNIQTSPTITPVQQMIDTYEVTWTDAPDGAGGQGRVLQTTGQFTVTIT